MKRALKQETGKREQVVKIGVAVFTEKGFHNTSVDEIVQAAGVPKGSFAYYFGSKDQYAISVIQAYGDYFSKKMDRVLSDKSLSPIARLKAFTAEASEGMERFAFRRGCLVGNLGQELASLDEDIRMALMVTLQNWQGRIRACLDEAKEAGEIATEADTTALARLFWYQWEGAVLAAKLEKSKVPLEMVSRAFLEHVMSLGPRVNKAVRRRAAPQAAAQSPESTVNTSSRLRAE